VSGSLAPEPLPIEARAALALQLRISSVRDVAVMRAIEQAPRALFAPHRFRDLAARNMALPIGCGQTMPAPAELGRRLEVLSVRTEHRVLEIGTGSGYGAAVLSRIVRDVVSIERYETLAVGAASRLESLAVENVRVLFADGLAPTGALGVFDRIILHMSLKEPPKALLDLLAPGGVMVFGRRSAAPAAGKGERPRLIRLESAATGSTFVETDRGACRLGAAQPGRALAL
jgi:protein-L-isoaspartate(D-aspartate) O-methyltransferase